MLSQSHDLTLLLAAQVLKKKSSQVMTLTFFHIKWKVCGVEGTEIDQT